MHNPTYAAQLSSWLSAGNEAPVHGSCGTNYCSVKAVQTFGQALSDKRTCITKFGALPRLPNVVRATRRSTGSSLSRQHQCDNVSSEGRFWVCSLGEGPNSVWKYYWIWYMYSLCRFPSYIFRTKVVLFPGLVVLSRPKKTARQPRTVTLPLSL